MLVRYYAVVMCPSVCPSVRHKPALYRNHWTNRAAFWQEDFFSPVPHCVIRNFEHLQKLRYFPLGTLSETPDLQKFRSASRSRCQQNSSSSSSTVELVDDTCTTVDESWLFTTSRSTVTLQLHYCNLLWICCTNCFDNWQNFDWHGASRGPSAVAELLVYNYGGNVVQNSGGVGEV